MVFPCQLNTIVTGLKENEPLLDSILTHMGNMHEKLENFVMAINLYKRAISIMEIKYGEFLHNLLLLLFLYIRMLSLSIGSTLEGCVLGGFC